MNNQLFYGDNLDILRKHIAVESVDLCYIDPPFNSNRNYNQIYNNLGTEDTAQAQAFTDTWVWDASAMAGLEDILENASGSFQPQTVELVKGLHAVLGRGSLLAYLISITLRVNEIQRVLTPQGSFYLHCDPTASHYLKLILDGIFCSRGGNFINEIIWSYRTGGASKKHFSRKHDVIFLYSKGKDWTFNPQKEKSYMMHKYGFKKSDFQIDKENGLQYSMVYARDVLEIPTIGSDSSERLGYPTQKPEALLQRLILASSNEGDVVLDAYCGCGTTIAAAHTLKRRWIGIDITYQSISVILRRMEMKFAGQDVLSMIDLSGIPRDLASAKALAAKKDDRLRKEFEKWAVLTYTNNRAVIQEKKGADAGIDGVAFFKTGKHDNAKIIFQVKSGGVQRSDIATLRGDMEREQAALAVLITLQEPSRPMIHEAKGAGQYKHEDMGRYYDRISIVTVQEIVEDGKRLEIPMSLEVLKSAQKDIDPDLQMELL